jgi:hypothetical protein
LSWPHTPESESERRGAQALLDAAGATLAPEYETDPRPSFVGVERRVHVLLSQLRSRAPEHVIEQAIDLVDHGEYAIALEDLAENLFEHAIALCAEDLERFGKLARELRLREGRWSFIRQLERHDDATSA